MRDTTGASLERYHELLRAQAPHERLARAMSLSRMVRELAVSGIRQRFPSASPARKIQSCANFSGSARAEAYRRSNGGMSSRSSGSAVIGWNSRNLERWATDLQLVELIAKAQDEAAL